MSPTTPTAPNPPLGASLSLHRCNELGLDAKAVLWDALTDLGCRRFRLMSYWNLHEPDRHHYDFSQLDWQLDMIGQHTGQVSLSLGLRQPRWPEFHMPTWAQQLPASDWHQALQNYLQVVVERYRNHPALSGWQLENEALLKSFGYGKNIDYDRHRMQLEYNLVAQTDPNHPITMTLSDSWGLPWRRPKPDQYAVSLYRITVNRQGRTVYSKRPAWFYRGRAGLIRLLRQRPVWLHELQAEPWFSQAITEVPLTQQLQQMTTAQLGQNLAFAKRTGLQPIDLWGLEWWYWLRTKHRQPDAWNTMKLFFVGSKPPEHQP